MTGGLDAVDVAACGPERAEEVHRLTQAAFGSQRHLDPPSRAGRESVKDRPATGEQSPEALHQKACALTLAQSHALHSARESPAAS